uniref:Deleted in lung and esophageal cancer protein 1 Ig-like domain-containing protein n=1 Tax=Astatotilapia calliptera TaxID=8154 RepID=A0AAX7TDT6_ASTCA
VSTHTVIRVRGTAGLTVTSHVSAAHLTANISHVLASIFKDLYTNDIIRKDTVSNLVQTKRVRGSYHDRYVEELQQVIIYTHLQLVKKITVKSQLKNNTVLFFPYCHTVKSAFSWCVDEDLLEMNNLISPKDYLATQKPHVRAPAAAKKDNLGTTCIQIQNVIPSKSSSKPNHTKPKPKWKGEPSVKDRADGWEKLLKLKDRQSFLRNPRFLPLNSQQGGTSLIRPRTKGKAEPEMENSCTPFPIPVFLAKPSVVVFTDYSVGNIYEVCFRLKNVTSSSRHIRVIPPTTPYFSIGLGRFPGEGGVVAPGMSCKYTLRFAPDSLGDYKDFIVVETQAEGPFVVPIEAWRPPPILTLPRVLDCGYCLIGGVKFVEFLCQNVGLSTGTFCIIPKDEWPASNFRSLARTYFSEQPPFAVSPSLFVLEPGEATVVEVSLDLKSGRSCQVFTVVCDNCQVKDISIEGEGQLIALELVSVSGGEEPPVVGEVHDLTAEHFIRFSPCNPHSVQQKKLVIRNNV